MSDWAWSQGRPAAQRCTKLCGSALKHLGYTVQVAAAQSKSVFQRERTNGLMKAERGY